MKSIIPAKRFALTSGVMLLAAMTSLHAEAEIVPGATESSPSRSQYFS